MRKNEKQGVYLTFSEAVETYPDAALKWNWSARMFFHYSEGGLMKRRFNSSVKSYEYSKKHLHRILRMVNSNLDDLKINIQDD